MVTCRVIPYEGSQLALPIKPGKVKPVVSHCLVIGDRLDPYQAPVIERLPVGYATPQSVRLVRGVSVDLYPKRVTYNKPEFNADHTFVYCLPDDESWATVQRLHDEFQVALEAIAKHLIELGAYSLKLQEAGGLEEAPNPLTPTVILTEDPYDARWGAPNYVGWWGIPKIERRLVVKHTALFMQLQDDPSQPSYQSSYGQRGKFCCPNDAAWQRLEDLHRQAIAISEAIQKQLENLGTYQQARMGKVLWLNQRKPEPESNLQFVPVQSVEELAVGDRVTPAHRPGNRYGRVTGFRDDRKTPVLVTFDGSTAEGKWGANALLKVVDKHTCIQDGNSKTQAATSRDNTSGSRHSEVSSEQPKTDDEDDCRATENLPEQSEKVSVPTASPTTGDDQQEEQPIHLASIPPELKVGDRVRITAVQPHQSQKWVGKFAPVVKVGKDRIRVEVEGQGGRAVDLPLPHDCVELVQGNVFDDSDNSGLSIIETPTESTTAGEAIATHDAPPELKVGDLIEAEIISFDVDGRSCWITVQGVVRERNRYDRKDGIPIEHIHFDRDMPNGTKAWDCAQPDRIRRIDNLALRCSIVRYLSSRENPTSARELDEDRAVLDVKNIATERGFEGVIATETPPEPDPYIQPIKPFQDEALKVTLEPADWVQVVADDDLYEKVVLVSRILATFEIEIVYDGLHFAYPRSSLRLHERATTESLFLLKVENDKFRKSLEEGYSKVKTSAPKLESQRRKLLAELDKVRREGAIAPTGCWMESYTTYKKLASGERKPFTYSRIRAEKAIFEKDGKPVKRLHLGGEADPQCQEWQQRLERRRKVNALERKIDKIERELQSKRQP